MFYMNIKELKKNSKLSQSFKLNSRCLITGFILLVISIILFGLAYMISSKDLGEAKNFTDLVANSEIKEGMYASLTVTEEPIVFAEYDDRLTSDKYYFLFNGEFVHIGYLDYGTYTDLKTQSSFVDSPEIKGIVKPLPEDVLDLAVEAYNEILGINLITKDNFSTYFSMYYLDVVSPAYDNGIQLVAGFIFLILGLVLLLTYYIRHRQTKKGIRSKSENEWKNIFSELDSEDTKFYKKLNLYLTENYIVDLSNGLRVVEYKDIVWMYQFQMSRYGITVSKNIVLATKNREKISIANMDNFMKRSKKDYTDIMNFIISKNESIVLGYTKENRKQMKDLYGIK